ncbi:MAG: hypothetical protein L0287_23555, partial [Anaerolineae bacterium]|nr:hypothetical protein [Anaerolineae bacterium]
VVYLGTWVLAAFVVAQFVLPVETWTDRQRAFRRLVAHGIKWSRGPAVFVRNGRLVSRVGEEDNANAGVVVVDLRSAVVVEQEYPHLGEANDFPGKPVLEEEPVLEQRRRLLRNLRLFRREEKVIPVARVLGPGIQFTNLGEKIRATVDLRKQVRFARGKPTVTGDGSERLESGVKAFTRDAIEVGTNCYVVFSLSEPPDVIRVGYWGGNGAKHLHELECENEGDTVMVKKTHRLDPRDAEEIHQTVSSAHITPSSTVPSSGPGSALYPLDQHRVFDAAYGQSSGISSTDKFQWHELPLSIAADIFHSLLEKYNLDYLYSADDPEHLPWMEEFKPEFSRHVKYEGVLSYQLARPAGLLPRQGMNWNIALDEKPLYLKLGEKYSLDTLEFSAAYPLMGLRSLRDRGIKVVFAGFSELKMPHTIREKLVERWKARWEREIQVVLARQEREAMQIISSARARAQRENAYFLSNLFKEEKYSTEALALLLFQSLELAATDLKNPRDLPPKEVLAMLQNLHNWLLKERQEMIDRKRRQKGKGDVDGREDDAPV